MPGIKDIQVFHITNITFFSTFFHQTNQANMYFTKALSLLATIGTLASAAPTGSMNVTHLDNLPTTHGSANTNGANGGSVDIHNNMKDTIYYWSVSQDAGSMKSLEPGASYTESWRTNPDGGGISIKMAMKPEQVDVLQYEYTLQGDTIFWDLSLIDMGTGSKFTEVGFAVTSNDSGCPSATCAPGDTACADAYLVWNDDHATHGCPAGTQMTLNIGPAA
ncbi:conserved hypothetical protein [Talaromyces stipitatus ATCC 10500]|uniref:Extracellular thaumatin domain protein n=1 Tax=Talaromyces stipitatus (strain ATCC 10500 / CBS 375.48 / QM 6759 / NRRL 1006) TaxID=441959 RepID=B8M7M0_TALSN|nr:uncharacterized protein TSTA_028560 [Talaromyces stipitatus ATCC 10500]EED19573.1 conserved hypothetical protein [Talaromyces stipitatus ATCC 10500]